MKCLQTGVGISHIGNACEQTVLELCLSYHSVISECDQSKKKKATPRRGRLLSYLQCHNVNSSSKSNFVTLCTTWMPEHKCILAHMQDISAFMFQLQQFVLGSVSLKTSALLLTIKICKSTYIFLQVAHKIQFQWNTILLQFPIKVVLNCLISVALYYVYTGLTEQESKFCQHCICFTVTISLW
jgi:hypothetical protein